MSDSKFPISHLIKLHKGLDVRASNAFRDQARAVNPKSVRGVRPDRWVIRHERG